jgi:tRNA modification GTPase
VGAEDVIVALATPPGIAALAVVRWSGPQAWEVVTRVCRPMRPGPWRAARPRRVVVVDANGAFDDGVLLLGRGPSTYTGEDTAELTVHGSPAIVARLLDAAVAAGARVAEPGAFTRRALAHGKLDVLGAEAVLALTHARTPAALAAARGLVDGPFAAAVADLRARLLSIVARLEIAIDLPDDAPDDAASVADALMALSDDAAALATTGAAGRFLVSGARVAVVGAVNAGKSSLINALVGRERLLVDPTPGTTRDVVEVTAALDGVPVTWLDTAGLREGAGAVETAGISLGRSMADEADLWLVVVRAGAPVSADVEALLEAASTRPHVVAYNGVDAPHAPAPAGWLPTVAVDGRGVQALGERVRRALVGGVHGAGEALATTARQASLLAEVATSCREAAAALPVAGALVAADVVMEALRAVDGLRGEDTPERVLDALFSAFCVGK